MESRLVQLRLSRVSPNRPLEPAILAIVGSASAAQFAQNSEEYDEINLKMRREMPLGCHFLPQRDHGIRWYFILETLCYAEVATLAMPSSYVSRKVSSASIGLLQPAKY